MKVLRVADITLFTGCMLGSALLSYLVYRHGWSDHYWPLVAACVTFLACLQLQPSARINVALIVLSTIMASYMAEILLAFVFVTVGVASPTHWLTWPSFREEALRHAALAKASSRDFDMRSRAEVIADLKQQGVEAVPSIPVSPVLLREEPSGALSPLIAVDGKPILPFGGIANRTTVLCNESGDYVTYDSDPFGFHNPKHVWDRRSVEIGIVGDSYTQGSCVPSDKNFAALIRQQIPSTLNLGMAGNGPLSELGGIREYLAGAAPKLVLWFYYEGNDLTDLAREQHSPLLMNYLATTFSQELRPLQFKINEALIGHVEAVRASLNPMGRLHALISEGISDGGLAEELERIVKLTHVRDRVRAAAGVVSQEDDANRPRPLPASVQQIDLIRKVFQVAQESIRTNGGHLVVVYLPQWERYHNPILASPDRDRVLALIKDMGIPVVDMHPAFAAQQDPLGLFPFRQRGHYNVEGHRLVAEEVLRFLSATDVLKGHV